MYTSIVNVLDQYYLAKRQNDKARQLELADVLVERWIPAILQGTSETTTISEIEEETLA